MKKKILALCILGILILNMLVVPASAAVTNPYDTTNTPAITNVSITSNKLLQNDVQYFTSSVTSIPKGTADFTRTFTTYGAIGGENTRMFVYSIGNDSNTDFKTKTVKAIMQQFAEDNPDWIPVAAINGDFFDIETSSTSGMGEPENVMIQMGNVLKGHYLQGTAGAGVIGIKSDDSVIFHINGFTTGTTSYAYKTHSTYGTAYNLTVMDSDKATTLGTHSQIYESIPTASRPTFVTPDSDATDLTGYTVYVVNCDTYRYAFRGGSGQVDSEGDYTYFFSGTVASTRAGTANEKPSSGQVYIAVSSSLSTTLAVGTYVKLNTAITQPDWKDVQNAVGFKQAVLVNGDSEFVKGLSASSTATTQVADMSYSYCQKHRTAIGFKEDGTPVFLVIDYSGNSYGASYYEIAEQLKALGCVNGFVLDGGGSSTMIIRNDDGTYTNAFIGEGTNGRSVGNAIILAVPASGTVTPTPDTDVTTDETTEQPTEAATTEEPTTDAPTDETTTEPITDEPTTETGEDPSTGVEEESSTVNEETLSEEETTTEPEETTPIETDADIDEPLGGCGSSIGLPVITTIAISGGAFALTRKKKRRKK